MWQVIAVLALVFALASSFLSAVVFIGFSRKLEKTDISKLLEKSSEEISANYERQLRGIRAEWEDIYQKFMKLTGRAEKAKGLESSATQTAPPVELTTRAAILRKYREVHQ